MQAHKISFVGPIASISCLAWTLGACGVGQERELFDPEPAGEGAAFDAENPGADMVPKADWVRQYEIPEWVLETELVDPEIVVSLDGLTVHLFDRGGDFSRVYPTGVGALNSAGESFTPTGFFATSPDPDNGWWNVPDRFTPLYYGGFPFIRLTTLNSRAQNTYGLHGPITYSCRSGADGANCPLEDREWFLVRDYVSHGCVRMRAADIVELFYLIDGRASIPVTIQREVEVDDRGEPIEIEDEATDWPVSWQADDRIEYGELGARPDDWDACAMPEGWPYHPYSCGG